jgi:hypothetical protein
MGRRWTEEEARGWIAAWAQSGERLETFARRHGFGGERLRWWRERLERTPKQRGVGKLATLVPVVVRHGTPSVGAGGPVTLMLDGRARVDVNELNAATADWAGRMLAVFVGTRE